MDENIMKKIALDEELRASINLIKLGFGEFQNLDMANDFYYLPFQLISSGFERLMKCYICLAHIEINDVFPEPKLFKFKLKHDLLKIKQYIIDNHFNDSNIPALKDDLKYISTDADLHILIELLSEFGKFARYYNLDVITGETNPSIDVNTLWQEFETKLLLKDKTLTKKLNEYEQHSVVSDSITRTIIIKLEKFTRALARQFTLGKLGQLAQQYSPTVFPFLMLRDSELGKTDYRKQTTSYKEKESKSHKRSLFDEIQRRINKNYVSKKITKEEFNSDWPFYSNEVIIECRDKHWCIVSIDGYDYALNGSAAGRFKLENVHDAGMAILGKSIGEFINMSLELGKKSNL
jgi:hypothetical protein